MGTKGFGSIGQKAVETNAGEGNPKQVKKTNEDKRTNPLSQSRQLITARQIQKLAKGDNPVYLAIVRHSNNAPHTKLRSRHTPGRVVRFAAAHGMSESTKRAVNKQTGPKKDFVSVAEREREVISQVPVVHRERLENNNPGVQRHIPGTAPKGHPHPGGWWNTLSTWSQGVSLPTGLPYRLGPAEQDELEEQIRDLLAQGFIRPSWLTVWGARSLRSEKGWTVADVCGLQGSEQADYQGPLSAAADRSTP